MSMRSSLRHKGGIPLVILAIGNILAYLGSLEDAKNFLNSTIGLHFLPYFFVLVAAVLLLGYIAAFAFIMRSILIERTTNVSAFWLLAALPFLVLLLVLNFRVLPTSIAPDTTLQSYEKSWTNQLVAYHFSTGGVPSLATTRRRGGQVWTTAQVVAALLANTNAPSFKPELIRKDFIYIDNHRLPSGGWGYFNNYTWGVTEIAGWVAVARARAIQNGHIWTKQELPNAVAKLDLDIRFLIERQYDDGSWAPIEKGYTDATRMYSTLIATWGLIEALEAQVLPPEKTAIVSDSCQKAVRWILDNHDDKTGWRPNPSAPRVGDRYRQGLSAQVIFVLTRAIEVYPFLSEDPVFLEVLGLFLDRGDLAIRSIHANDVTDNPDQYISDFPNNLESVTFLWYPWSRAAYSALVKAPGVRPDDQARARELSMLLDFRANDLQSIRADDGIYQVAENLLGAGLARQVGVAHSRADNLLLFSRIILNNLPARSRHSGVLPAIVTIWSFFALFITLRLLRWRQKAVSIEKESGTRDSELVTIVLPVRDEALNVADCLASLQQQSGVHEIIVVNDHSEDDTVEIVKRIMKSNPKIRLIEASPLPKGWRGKVFAVSLGVEAAESEWLLMTDADTRHRHDLLERALHTAQKRSLDALSIAGKQIVRGLGENIVTPAVFFILDALLGDWERASSGDAAIANGQFILVKRDVLNAIGGLASIRNEVLDDVALANRLKDSKYRLGFFRELDLLSIRMYRGFRSSFSGWRRILGSFLGHRPELVLYLATLLSLPLGIVLSAIVTRDWMALAVCWAVGVICSAISRQGSRHSPLYGVFFPIDSLIVFLCLMAGWIDFRRGELATWKGRRLVLEDDDWRARDETIEE